MWSTESEHVRLEDWHDEGVQASEDYRCRLLYPWMGRGGGIGIGTGRAGPTVGLVEVCSLGGSWPTGGPSSSKARSARVCKADDGLDGWDVGSVVSEELPLSGMNACAGGGMASSLDGVGGLPTAADGRGLAARPASSPPSNAGNCDRSHADMTPDRMLVRFLRRRDAAADRETHDTRIVQSHAVAVHLDCWCVCLCLSSVCTRKSRKWQNVPSATR